MSGMPLAQALLLRLPPSSFSSRDPGAAAAPFLAIVLVASAFGLAAGFSTGFVGKAFGVGFARRSIRPDW